MRKLNKKPRPGTKIKSKSPKILDQSHYDFPRNIFLDNSAVPAGFVQENVYDVVGDSTLSIILDNSPAIYENVPNWTAENYDVPVSHRNKRQDLPLTEVYDVPRGSAAATYDFPKTLPVTVLTCNESNEYDSPKNFKSSPSTLVLKVNDGNKALTDKIVNDSCEEDSLDDEPKSPTGHDYVNLNFDTRAVLVDKSVDQATPYHSETAQKKSKEKSNQVKSSKIQTDRAVDVYNETVRQRTNRRNKVNVKDLAAFQVFSAKEDVNNQSTIGRMKKLLPSVRALRHRFESRNDGQSKEGPAVVLTNQTRSAAVRKWKSSTVFNENSSMDSTRSYSSSLGSLDDTSSSKSGSGITQIQSIVEQFDTNNHELYKARKSTAKWDPTELLKKLYEIPEPSVPAEDHRKNSRVNLEGFLEKLPAGRRKATFWNAWKKRYFKLSDGFLYCYNYSSSETPSLCLQLANGDVESMDDNMIGVNDEKGHHVVIRGSCVEETRRWYDALLTHLSNSSGESYVKPLPIPQEPHLFKNIVVIDIGSCSIRAGILTTQPSLPQAFFPSVAAIDKISGKYTAFGNEALLPEIRSRSSLVFPVRSSGKISKLTMDFEGLKGLIRTAFQQLKVEPSSVGVQISLPRRLSSAAQKDFLEILFNEFQVKSVNLAHQSILALLSYNATTGIVVDIGERIEVVPIMDGYILESGVSHVPYGGPQLTDHMRHFLVQQKCFLITDVESYIIRHVLEQAAYTAGPDPLAYLRELAKARADSASVEALIDLTRYGDLPWKSIRLAAGRFQVVEGLFRPEAWGLDYEGLPKLVYKTIQACSVDIRREMASSVYLSGGVTLLPGLPERLQAELVRMLPPQVVPKVNVSPYRYHAAYIGACGQANSASFEEISVSRDEWISSGSKVAQKWKI